MNLQQSMEGEGLQNEEYDIMVKFVVVGEAGVGKSCTIMNWTSGKVNYAYSMTIGCDFASRTVQMKDDVVKVQIWDTGGAEYFRSLTRQYYRQAIGAVLFYDITNKKTFENIPIWQNEIRENSHKDVQLLLVGNKKDKTDDRQVDYHTGSQFAEDNGMKFLETCAFDLETVDPVFIGMINDIIENIDANKYDLENESLGLILQNKRLMSKGKITPVWTAGTMSCCHQGCKRRAF